MNEKPTERRLTAEAREKLLGLLPFDSTQTLPFTPKFFKDPERELPSEFWPVFHLKPFTKEQKDRFKVLVERMGKKDRTESDKDEDDKAIADLAFEGIARAENVFDLNGGELVKEKDFEEVFRKFRPEIILATMMKAALISDLLIPEVLGLKY